jgi:hypothetical protein
MNKPAKSHFGFKRALDVKNGLDLKTNNFVFFKVVL